MQRLASSGLVVLTVVVLLTLVGRNHVQPANRADGTDTLVSFKQDVTPILGKFCLPCHAEENYNPSELSLDSYDLLMAGGKHGKPVMPGDSKESILVVKLGADPPFGHPMPLKKKRDPEQIFLSPDMIQTICRWIDQGAQNN